MKTNIHSYNKSQRDALFLNFIWCISLAFITRIITMHGPLNVKNYCTFFITSRSILLRMRNISDKSCRENQNKHFTFNNFFFFENCAVYEIMCKNIVRPDGPQMTTWRMHIACWIPEATNTHSGYVILIAFPRQQWLHERASLLRFTYVNCLYCYFSEICIT